MGTLLNEISGEYTTSLQYTQASVPVLTDSSLNMLLPVLAQPIVQRIVTGSNLGYASVFNSTSFASSSSE